jgi:hypothetical protein
MYKLAAMLIAGSPLFQPPPLGGTNDALAFLKWKFSKYLKDLMEAFIVLGDNAYVIDLIF